MVALQEAVGLFASLLLHGLVLVALWWAGSVTLTDPPQDAKPAAITVSLVTLPPQLPVQPPARPAQKATPEPAPKPAKPSKKQSAPIIKKPQAPIDAAVKHVDTLPASPPATTAPASSKEKAAEATARYESLLAAHIERFRQYPRRARELRMTGTGTVTFHINPDGYASDIKVIQSTGHYILDDEMRATIARAAPLPKPLREAGRHFTLPMRFHLR